MVQVEYLKCSIHFYIQICLKNIKCISDIALPSSKYYQTTGAQSEMFIGGGADPEAICNLFYFTNYVIKSIQ